MRRLNQASEADHPMVVEDANGNGFQYMPETKVAREKGTSRWTHTMEGGWWDLSMIRRAESEIRYPVTIVWEAS